VDDSPTTPTPAMAVPVLEYGRPGDHVAAPPGVWLRGVCFALSLLAAGSIFLPFAFGVTPLDALTHWDDVANEFVLILLAVPFLAGVPIAAWSLRRLVRPRLTRGERWIVLILAIAFAAAMVWASVRTLVEGDLQPVEVFLILIGPALLAGVVVVFIWQTRRGRRDAAAVAALNGAYVANAVMLLIIFHSIDEWGWWVTAVAVAGLIFESAVWAWRR
jgi:hypothetical protein